MAFVVSRPAGRWEVRESASTPAGPRSRSLATFRVLTDDVLERAGARAATPFVPSAVLASARRAGAPVGESRADAAARALIVELARGRIPRPGLVRLLSNQLDPLDPPELAAAASIADQIATSDEDRGVALRDLLDLSDRLPPPRRTELQFPGLRPIGARG